MGYSLTRSRSRNWAAFLFVLFGNLIATPYFSPLNHLTNTNLSHPISIVVAFLKI